MAHLCSSGPPPPLVSCIRNKFTSSPSIKSVSIKSLALLFSCLLYPMSLLLFMHSSFLFVLQVLVPCTVLSPFAPPTLLRPSSPLPSFLVSFTRLPAFLSPCSSGSRPHNPFRRIIFLLSHSVCFSCTSPFLPLYSPSFLFSCLPLFSILRSFPFFRSSFHSPFPRIKYLLSSLYLFFPHFFVPLISFLYFSSLHAFFAHFCSSGHHPTIPFSACLL